MKMLYLAIRIHKSISDFVFFTAKNNKFFWKNNYISTTCKVTMKPSLHIKPVVLDLGSARTDALRFLQSVYRKQTGESTSPRWKRKRQVGSKLYNNLHWNHLRQVCISVFMALSTVYHSMNSPDNSPLSYSVLPILILPDWSFQPHVSLWIYTERKKTYGREKPKLKGKKKGGKNRNH